MTYNNAKEIYFYDENKIRFDAKIVGIHVEKGYRLEFKTGNDKRYPFPYIFHEVVQSHPTRYHYYIKT